MKKQKTLKITNTMQKVAVDILERLCFCKTLDDVFNVYAEMYKKYQLCDDPFTRLPCTSKECYENQLEYDRQLAIEKYGYCDWLD